MRVSLEAPPAAFSAGGYNENGALGNIAQAVTDSVLAVISL
jgi:hypothetical protein